MKIKLLLLLFVSVRFQANAQNTDPLVNAERAFEKSCLEKGIRDGFLASMDSNAIAFTGKGPVAAKPFWTSLPAFEGIFSWSASYSELSIGGDWGYTTGNYEHRARTLQDSVEDAGQYSTVWHKTGNGEWKYLIDIGNGHPHMPLDKNAGIIDIEKFSGQERADLFLTNQEQRFINSYERNIRTAYQDFGSRKYILNLSGYQPVTSSDSAVLLIEKKQSAFKYHPSGIKISSAGDMAAVYGIFDHKDGKGNYLRIWRHEKNGWKIALEVLKSTK